MTDEIQQHDKTSPHGLDGISRRTLLKASGVGAGGLTLGASARPAAAQQEEGDDGDEPDPDIGDFRVPYLDRDTLEAEFEDETLQAESIEGLRPGSTTYVGEAAGRPGLFVGVSHLTEEPNQAGEDEQPPELVAYLCDGEPGTPGDIGLWLTGEFDETGTTLTPEEDQEGEVRLALVDGEVLGAARLRNEEEPVPFITSETTGDAGLFQAATEVGEMQVIVRWIVLPDGRQRGIEFCCVVVPPGVLHCGPCVHRF